MDGTGVGAGAESGDRVVVRAVSEIVIEGRVKTPEGLRVVVTFEEDDVLRIDLANLRYQPPINGIHSLEIGLVILVDVPRIITDFVVGARLVQYVVAGNHRAIGIAPREFLPKGNIAILVGRAFPEQADTRSIVRV